MVLLYGAGLRDAVVCVSDVGWRGAGGGDSGGVGGGETGGVILLGRFVPHGAMRDFPVRAFLPIKAFLPVGLWGCCRWTIGLAAHCFSEGL